MAASSTAAANSSASASASSAASPSSAAATPPVPTTAPTISYVGELLTRMNADMASATSVRVTGSLTVDGQKASLDVALNTAGGAYGTVHTAQGDLILLRAGGKDYAQVTDDFIKQQNIPRGSASLVLGKYVLLDAAESQGFDQFLDLKAFLAVVSTTSTDGDTITGATQIAGTPVDIVAGADGSTFYVATQGKALPLRVAGGGDTSGQIDFLGWNTDLRIPGVPPASEVIDASKFAS
ncbi:hypothetical protein ABH920_003961 [Catenulispora sp. EB89]|uniref:hypothetical protein n=1 Tax=Catenulispora sp. EB89 TaxID=3156257 RepID=UPI0035198D4C